MHSKKYSEHRFAESDIRNILLDYICLLKCHLEQFDRCEVDPEISELLDLLNTNSALCTYANVPNESGIVLVLKNGDRDNSKAKRKKRAM